LAKNKSIVIIGSGIAGIASAIRMKSLGLDVSVYESKDSFGGKLAEKSIGEFRFDLGPSLFTMPHLVDELFTMSGRHARDYFNYLRLDEICQYYFNSSEKLISYSDEKKFRNELIGRYGHKGLSVLEYFKEVRSLYDITSHIFLEKSLHRISSFLNFKTLISFMKLYRLKLHRSLASYNHSFFNNDELEKVFNRFATYNGSDPFQCPSTLRVIPHLEQNIGTFLPTDGMRSITESLYNLAVDLGVQFYFNTPVKEIILDKKNKVRGILTQSEKVDSEIVISNSDVNFTYKNLLSNYNITHASLKNPLSSSAIIFYWGMNLKSQLGVHNILFSEDYKNEFHEIFNKNSVPTDPTIYIHISSKIKSDDAPVDCENWFVMVNTAPNSGQNWEELLTKTRALVITKISSYLSLDIAEYIKEEFVRNPSSLEAEAGAFKGALYGSNSNSIFSAFLRHPNFNSRIKGLYFCGGTVHPGGGIPLCLQSAKIATSLIKEDYKF